MVATLMMRSPLGLYHFQDGFGLEADHLHLRVIVLPGHEGMSVVDESFSIVGLSIDKK